MVFVSDFSFKLWRFSNRHNYLEYVVFLILLAWYYPDLCNSIVASKNVVVYFDVLLIILMTVVFEKRKKSVKIFSPTLAWTGKIHGSGNGSGNRFLNISVIFVAFTNCSSHTSCAYSPSGRAAPHVDRWKRRYFRTNQESLSPGPHKSDQQSQSRGCRIYEAWVR